MTMLLHEATQDRAHRRGGATAVALGDDRLSYAELELQSNRFAQGLVELGCRSGEMPLIRSEVAGLRVKFSLMSYLPLLPL